MEFTVGGGTPVFDPSPAEIEAGLSSLTGDGDSFAILAQTEMSYIQTSGSPADGFLLEYQLGSLDQHFRSTSLELPLATVVQAFVRYARSDASWRDVTHWEQDDGAAGGGSWGAIMLVAVVLGAAAMWWIRGI